MVTVSRSVARRGATLSAGLRAREISPLSRDSLPPTSSSFLRAHLTDEASSCVPAICGARVPRVRATSCRNTARAARVAGATFPIKIRRPAACNIHRAAISADSPDTCSTSSPPSFSHGESHTPTAGTEVVFAIRLDILRTCVRLLVRFLRSDSSSNRAERRR